MIEQRAKHPSLALENIIILTTITSLQCVKELGREERFIENMAVRIVGSVEREREGWSRDQLRQMVRHFMRGKETKNYPEM